MENKEQLVSAIKDWVKLENEISVLRGSLKREEERKNKCLVYCLM